MPGMRINVRSNVHLRDSEAGSHWSQDRKPYYAEEVLPAARRPVMVPVSLALVALCVLFVVFGTMILVKAGQRSSLSHSITAMQQNIRETEEKNLHLAVELAEARDSVRISFTASQKLGMISASAVEAIPVTAPDTRPYENSAARTDDSPYSVQNARISGSR